MDSAKRVLLVEDDAHIAELLRMHLRDEGYAVVHAADGHAGQREMERGNWDALVLDLRCLMDDAALLATLSALDLTEAP